MKLILDIGVLIVTIQMMVAVGLDLETRHFRELARRKRLLFGSLAAHALVLPAVAVVVVRFLPLPPHISAGILLLAACPIGDIANFYTLLARGNVALSVALNTVSCLLSTLTMALIFEAYHYVLGSQFVLAVPTPTLAARLTLMVAVPVLVGMLLRRTYPWRVDRLANWLRNASIIGVAFLLVYITIAQRQRLAADWRSTALVATLFMVVALIVGLAFSWTTRLGAADRFATLMCFAVRNVGLATAIAVAILNKTEYAVFAAVYFLTEVPLMLAAVAVQRGGWKFAQAQEVVSPVTALRDEPAMDRIS